MLESLLRIVLLAATAIALVGCGATPAPDISTSDFLHDLRVLPQTFSHGGGATFSSTVSAQPGEEWLLEIHAEQATGLRAILLEVEYDAQRWQPLSAAATKLFAGGAASGPQLELSNFGLRGTAVFGAVFAHPAGQRGFNGSGVVAQLRFERAGRAAQAMAFPPSTDSENFPWRGLEVTPAPARKLLLRYGLDGDYDQNGEVNIADLLPLAQHLFEKVPVDYQDTPLGVLDGDQNGRITLADIAPIGQNYRRQVGYRIYRTRNYEQLPWDFSDSPGSGAAGMWWPAKPHGLPVFGSGDWRELQGDPRTQRLFIERELDDAAGYYYFVEGCDQAGAKLGTGLAVQPFQVMQHAWPMRLSYDAGAQTLSHYPSVPGDYSLDGRASAADMSHLGKWYQYHYLTLAEIEQIYAVEISHIDGNDDGSIDLGDIFPLYLFYDQRCEFFHVYRTLNTAEVPGDALAPSVLTRATTSSGRVEGLSLASGEYIWIRPVYHGAEGPCSEVLQIP